MTVGKARARSSAKPDSSSHFTVSCLTHLDTARIEGHMRRNEFFWLDLHDPTPEQIVELGELFGFHPLALEDTEHFGQRAKLDDYGDYVFLVF